MPDFGDGSPREDYGALDVHAPSVANGQITPEQWAEYQSKRRRDAVLGMLGTVGGAMAGGALTSWLGGGGSAAGSAASGAGGALPPIAGGSPWAMTPLATTATMSAPGALAGAGAGGALGAAAGAGGSALAGAAKNFLGLSPRDWAALIPLIAGTVGTAVQGNRPPMQPTSQTTDPQLQKLIATMQGRLDQSEPLYKSIMAMANGLLPTQYQNGGQGR